MRGNRFHGAGITLVCIDSYHDGVMTGRLYNSRLGEAETFRSTIGFLTRMEQMLAIEDTPQAFNAVRSFAPVMHPIPDPPAATAVREGKLATLELHILFRQNASWQGSVCWQNENRIHHFRSVLELLFLIDSALGGISEQSRERGCSA